MKVVKSQMDQEAEIMKQSMARRDAAQAAAEEVEGEEEPQQPIRTVSSGGRGRMCACLSSSWLCGA